MDRLLRFLLGAYIFLLPVQFDVGPARAAPSDAFILAYAALGLGRIRPHARTWSVWHSALILVFFVGVFQAAVRDGTLTSYVLVNKTIGLAVLFLTYAILASEARSWDAIRWMLRLFVIAVAIHAAISAGSVIVAEATGVNVLPWMNYLGRRASGMLIDPNAFGGLVVVALVIHTTTFFGGAPLIRGVAGYLAMGGLAIALILTLSRTAWIGMSAACVLGTLLRPKLLAAYSLAALLAAGAILGFVGAGGADSIAHTANRSNTTQQRIDQINQAIPMVAERPILGSGLGAFIRQHGWIIHNTTMWILTELGFIGLFIYAGFMFWFYGAGFSAYRMSVGAIKPAAVGLMCAHLGMQAVSVGIEAFYQRHWWFVMAMLACANVVAMGEAGSRYLMTRELRADRRQVATA